ncbi:hypothetical protein JW935_09085 [candidate division KSB1 bacterium]|nr:hypothetical protein [candidate division KSB1 bacterium]
MKKLFLLFGIAVLLVQYLFAGAVIKDFSGEAGMNKVKLKWVVTAENSVEGYRLLRKFDGGIFEEIAFIRPQAEGSSDKQYVYIDASVFKTAGRTCYYKLQIVNLDKSFVDYGQIVTVSPQISAARHTWGSIKAMFR